MRQFLFSLRKSVIGGGEDAYEEAFKLQAARNSISSSKSI